MLLYFDYQVCVGTDPAILCGYLSVKGVCLFLSLSLLLFGLFFSPTFAFFFFSLFSWVLGLLLLVYDSLSYAKSWLSFLLHPPCL
jgi:hypothetical protein